MHRKTDQSKPKFSTASNVLFMLRAAWRVRRSVLWLCLAQIGLGLANSLLGLFAAPQVLSAIEQAVPLGQLLATIGLFTLGLTLVSAATAYIGDNVIYDRIAVRTDLLSQVNGKLCQTAYTNTLQPAFLALLKKSEKAINSNDSAGEIIWETLQTLALNVLGFILYLFLIASLDPVVILITLVSAIVSYGASLRINGWGYRRREQEAACWQQFHHISSLSQDIRAAKDIRIFGMKPWLDEIGNAALHAYHHFIHRAQRIYLWADILDILLTLLRNGVAYAYLITLTLRQGLSAAQFLLYFSAVGGFTAWVTGILSTASELHRNSLDLSALRECLSWPEPFTFEGGAPLPAAQRYELRLAHVTFRYPEASADTIHDLTLTIHPGEKLALVGLNGAGKTTLVKLLCGFLDPTSGCVLLNGKDIRQYNRREYYRLFSAVFQDFSLLAATLGENVAQSDTYDRARAESCIALAGLSEKIRELPLGLDTHLGKEVYEDAVELSGGQLQRLMLARAIYKDGPILVLDEPTAALDPLAESDIYCRYHELSRNKTSLFISHRLASTQFCDRILLLKNGVIAEEGTHEALLRRGGEYARLFEVQSRYYQEGEASHEA